MKNTKPKPLMKKEQYKKLKPFLDKIDRTLSSKSVYGYTHRDLGFIQNIFYELGGSKRLSISRCNSCVLQIFHYVQQCIYKYEKRYNVKRQTK